ncbi:MAG TPA: hydrogenase iron-sulfur subunit [Gemmatimonadales bacterium]
MPRLGPQLTNQTRRVLTWVDATVNRLYGWRFNPLYQSGALATALLSVVLLTGVYLLFFYKVSAPYDSVARLADQVWLGRWVRSLHRYASDAALVAALFHALRMFAQHRAWGPRVLAWASGLILVFVVLVCGWTGYVMVWDAQGLALAREGARFLDALPLFSEPIGRSFVGERELPSAFFFLNLFLHVALPIGLGVLLWIHVSRVARPVLLPPRRLLWAAVGALLALSLIWPAVLGPEADVFRLPQRAPLDVFYNFWLPLTERLPAWTVWTLGSAFAAIVMLAPLWLRPAAPDHPPASSVDERLCTGCRQCYLDCPYEAIAMMERTDGRPEPVAHVDPALCVSCGICAGSCAPMGVGPPGRTGRDQLSAIRQFIMQRRLAGTDVVVIACTHGAGGSGALDGTHVYPIDCAGNLHTSVVEYLLRSGVGGVLVAACPGRDCWHREGPKWLTERLYHDREAELQPRVDKRRVRVAHAGAAERPALLAALTAFRGDLAALDAAAGEETIDLDFACEPTEETAKP